VSRINSVRGWVDKLTAAAAVGATRESNFVLDTCRLLYSSHEALSLWMDVTRCQAECDPGTFRAAFRPCKTIELKSTFGGAQTKNYVCGNLTWNVAIKFG
jgi:hypothetical protein